jgi:hypothetical protein
VANVAPASQFTRFAWSRYLIVELAKHLVEVEEPDISWIEAVKKEQQEAAAT